jgi:DNA-binding CsgD family transcriptional regulator/predicted hydrocarbon binding protein
MSLTKGIRFMNLRSFVTERSGEGAWEALLATLPGGEAAVVRGVVASGWYDHAIRARLVRALAGRRGAPLARELGRFEAERDLTTVHRWFIRLVKPSFAVRNMNVYWRRTEDSGRWTSEVRGSEIVARLYDWIPAESVLCGTVQGYLERTLELLGGGDMTVEHPRCRAGGNAFCEFRTERFRVEEASPPSDRAPSPGDLTSIASELADLADIEAVGDAIVGLVRGRLSFSRAALWMGDVDGSFRLVSAAGQNGRGMSRCFVLQVAGEVVGRLDAEAPPGRAETGLLDELLPCFAVALRNAAARPDAAPVPAVAVESGPASTGQRARRVAAAAARWTLTPKEREVLALVVLGQTNKEIACALDCQEGTVEVHVSRLLKKSRATNRAGLIARVWAKR